MHGVDSVLNFEIVHGPRRENDDCEKWGIWVLKRGWLFLKKYFYSRYPYPNIAINDTNINHIITISIIVTIDVSVVKIPKSAVDIKIIIKSVTTISITTS